MRPVTRSKCVTRDGRARWPARTRAPFRAADVVLGSALCHIGAVLRRIAPSRAAMVALGLAGSFVLTSATPCRGDLKPVRTEPRCLRTGVPKGLRALATAHGKLVGTAYRSEFAAGDPCYDRVAVREFNSLTPEIATFSNRIAAVEGRDDFSDADSICRLARRHRMACQVQNLVWDPVDHPEWGIVPAWIRAQPPAQRRTTMTSYVRRVVGHFAARADSYTVVNEAFDAAGHLTRSTWNTTGDDSYIFAAFRAARRADPDGRLYYNDFGAEDLNAKSDANLRPRATPPSHAGCGRGRWPDPASSVDRRRGPPDARGHRGRAGARPGVGGGQHRAPRASRAPGADHGDGRACPHVGWRGLGRRPRGPEASLPRPRAAVPAALRTASA